MAHNSKSISATTQLTTSVGKVIGMTVSSTSSGTIALYDSSTSVTTDKVILATATPAALTSIFWGDEGIGLTKGLYAVIGSTLVVTLIYD